MTIIKYIQKETSTNFKNNPGYDYNQDMLNSNGIYYKKILSYEEYIVDKKKWNELIEMEENDFANYYVIVIAGENYDTTGLYISNISIENNKLCIDLNKKDAWDNATVLSTKISKDFNKDIIIRNNPNIPISSSYKPIEDLHSNYTIEQAIKDNCFVIEKNKIVSDDLKQLDNFIENCTNNTEGFIRIYNLPITNQITIIDIEYKNGKINMCSLNISNQNSQKVYNSGKFLKKSIITDSESNSLIYSLEDELGNSKAFLAIDNY